MHTISKAEITSGEQKVQAIIATIEKNKNPFQVVSDQAILHNLLTQEVVSDDIRSHLLSVVDIGTKAYETLRKERFVEKISKILIHHSSHKAEGFSKHS